MDPVVVESAVRYAHFLGILMLVAMLVTENILLKPRLEPAQASRIAGIDGLYGFSALITLGAGLMLWMSVGKPSEFYTSNPLFHTKISLFFLVAVTSVVPTIFFLKDRRIQGGIIQVPKHIILIKRLELVVIAFIPLFASLMARGIGISP